MRIENQLVYSEGEYNGIIENSITIDNAIISKTSYLKDPNPTWHCHENMHIAFVMQNAQSEISNKVYSVDRTGSVLFYHSGEMHKYTTFDPVSRSINIEIPHSFLKRYSLTDADIKRNIEEKANAKSLILNMHKELLMNSPETSNNIKSLVLELISSSERHEATPNWIFELKNILHDYWRESLDLETLGKTLSVHPVTISKNFKKYFGCTLGEYRRKIRIEKSIALIKENKMTLSEIAHYCCFADQSHFTRNFKEYSGYLPSEFQKL